MRTGHIVLMQLILLLILASHPDLNFLCKAHDYPNVLYKLQ